MQLCKLAAKVGDAAALSNVAHSYFMGRGCTANVEKGLKYLMKAAATNDGTVTATVFRQFAACFLNSPEDQFEYCKKAAKLGYHEAFEMCGQ